MYMCKNTDYITCFSTSSEVLKPYFDLDPFTFPIF